MVLWRQLADFASQYLSKGRLVFVEGRLQGRSWEACDGAKRRSVEIITWPTSAAVRVTSCVTSRLRS